MSQRRSFRPKPPLSSRSFLYKKKDDKEVIINNDELENNIKELSKYQDVEIEHLSSDIRKKYDWFLHKCILYHNTEASHILTRLINNYFKTSSVPDTIGSNCKKYINQSDELINQSVFSTTSRNNHQIVNAEFIDGRYELDQVKSGNELGYIFLNRTPNYRSFKGFSDYEKNKLRSYGIKSCILYNHNDDDNYTKIANQVNINHLKSRMEQMSILHRYNDHSVITFNKEFAIAIVIALILIIVFVVVRKSSSRR